jgi:uncharacterized protein (DUF1778 family)
MSMIAIADEGTAKASRRRHRETGTINLRVPDRTRQLIDTAAAVLGKSRTEFMLDSARQRAVDVLLDQRLFVLEPDQYDAFVKALDNPPPPDEKLVALMKRKPLWAK